MAAQKLPLLKTPAGNAIWPKLNKPDTKFNVDGEYSVKLAIPSEEAQDLIAQLDQAYAQSQETAKEKNPGKKIKAASKPYTEEVDDQGNETGNIVFNFKCKAKITGKDGSSFPNAPKLFDSANKPFPVDTGIWGGSTLRVAFNAIPYYTAMAGAGVSLRLKAVQVINLVSGGEGGNGSSYGFGEEEGYVAPEAINTNPVADVEEDEDDF